MNKPEGNDFFSVDHWNHNTDIIDSALAPTFEDYESSATVPETTTALSAIRSKTKIADLFKNIKAFCKGCCTLGMLVNNCVTDNANLPLSAAQGKMLMDQINSLNGDFSKQTTATNIIEFANTFTGKIALLYYNGDDYSWLPNQDGSFKYGTFIIECTPVAKKITALSWDGKKMATKVFSNGNWNDWIIWASYGNILKYKDLPKVETVTVSQSGYTRINVPDDAINYLFATVPTWLNNTGAFSICGSMHTFYVVGTPGTVVNNLTVRLWYK